MVFSYSLVLFEVANNIKMLIILMYNVINMIIIYQLLSYLLRA